MLALGLIKLIVFSVFRQKQTFQLKHISLDFTLGGSINTWHYYVCKFTWKS